MIATAPKRTITGRSKPVASLSLDLDNKWSYLKTHGDAGWDRFPSYLDTVVPRVVKFLAARDLTITWFIVGQDAALDRNHAALRMIADAGHEIGNHSFHHEPWLHLYTREQIEDELERAEDAIASATGVRPTGFRGPGFSASEDVLSVLADRGYRYDASTFPTYLGPLARMYYFMTAKLPPEERQRRGKLFGTVADGLRPNHPYRWRLRSGSLVEIPVTTMPLAKVPIHVSYLLFLARFSRLAARVYFQSALALCRITGVGPSILLHPLDFLGCDDDADLSFFPAMDKPASWKVGVVADAIDALTNGFRVLPMGEHAAALNADRLPVRTPDFAR
jgi:peptidoglycan/xylan/chitin deacetylase (PgdA/CDA1 family)